MAKFKFNQQISAPDFKWDTKKEFWEWFNQNEEDEIVSVGFWFFKVTITVGDLEPFFAMIFGPNPSLG